MPMKFVPCRARTPSSASNSCCRIRRWSARPVRSSGKSLSGFGSTTGSPWSEDVFITYEIAYLHSHSELIGAAIGGGEAPPTRQPCVDHVVLDGCADHLTEPGVWV